MNINWVIGNNLVLDPTVDIKRLKDLGSFWGSWKTWRSYQVDNVICHSMHKASELLERKFQTYCNFFIPEWIYTDLGRPSAVNLYQGELLQDVENQEEIVAMHLCASRSDIVLLLGLDFQEEPKQQDRLKEHQAHVRRHLMLGAIKNNPEIQWVIVDHTQPIRKEILDLPNVSKDTLSNILST